MERESTKVLLSQALLSPHLHPVWCFVLETRLCISMTGHLSSTKSPNNLPLLGCYSHQISPTPFQFMLEYMCTSKLIPNTNQIELAYQFILSSWHSPSIKLRYITLPSFLPSKHPHPIGTWPSPWGIYTSVIALPYAWHVRKCFSDW